LVSDIKNTITNTSLCYKKVLVAVSYLLERKGYYLLADKSYCEVFRMPEKGELVLSCDCEEGIRPFEKILEGSRCKCTIYFKEGDKSKDTGSEVKLGVVTLEIGKWKD